MRRHIDTLNREKKNSRLLIHKSYLITDVKLIYHFFLALSKKRELKEKLEKVKKSYRFSGVRQLGI